MKIVSEFMKERKVIKTWYGVGFHQEMGFLSPEKSIYEESRRGNQK
jgi:hypothetical protein